MKMMSKASQASVTHLQGAMSMGEFAEVDDKLTQRNDVSSMTCTSSPSFAYKLNSAGRTSSSPGVFQLWLLAGSRPVAGGTPHCHLPHTGI